MARLHKQLDSTQITHLSESLLTQHSLQLETQHLQDHMTRSSDLSQEDKLQHQIKELAEVVLQQEGILGSENRTMRGRGSVKHKP